jgi:hypothetical protein
VATKQLRYLRYPANSAVARPTTLGCYLHTYWIEHDRLDEVAAWLGNTLKQLAAGGRLFLDGENFHRTHVYSAFQPYAGIVYRGADDSGPRDIHALDYPYPGLVVEIIDAAAEVPREDLVRWLQTSYIPDSIVDSSAAMCLTFLHAPMPAAIGLTNGPPGSKQVSPFGDIRVTLLWFTDVEPQTYWERDFVGHGEVIKKSGLGELQLAAPFIPTLPGTDKYADQLR